MNDLIRRSKVLDLLYKIFEKYNMSTDKTSDLKSFGTDVFKAIKDMPTDYDVCKAVDELEDYKDRFGDEDRGYIQDEIGYTIEIIKQGGGVSDNVCEWKHVPTNNDTIRPFHHKDSPGMYKDVLCKFPYCSICGKKIKVVD